MVTADHQSTLLNHPATLICVVEVPRPLLPPIRSISEDPKVPVERTCAESVGLRMPRLRCAPCDNGLLCRRPQHKVPNVTSSRIPHAAHRLNNRLVMRLRRILQPKVEVGIAAVSELL